MCYIDIYRRRESSEILNQKDRDCAGYVRFLAGAAGGVRSEHTCCNAVRGLGWAFTTIGTATDV